MVYFHIALLKFLAIFLFFAFINSDELDVLIFRSKRDFLFREWVTKSRLSNSREYKVLIFLNTSNFLTKNYTIYIYPIFTQSHSVTFMSNFFHFSFSSHLDSCEIYFFSLIFIFIDEGN